MDKAHDAPFAKDNLVGLLMLAVGAYCVIRDTAGAWNRAIALRHEDETVRMTSDCRAILYFAFLQSASLACFDNASVHRVGIVGRLVCATFILQPRHIGVTCQMNELGCEEEVEV